MTFLKYSFIGFFSLAVGCVWPVFSTSTIDIASKVESLQESPKFKDFLLKKRAKLNAFQSQYLQKIDSVFYPFGGPDLMYPMTLFPDAKTFVLVGMEYPGEKLTANTMDLAFKNIDSLMVRGFFVTANMNKSLNHKCGVRAALALEILLLGGKIIEDKSTDNVTCTITFEMDGEQKVVHYLRRNLVDNADSVFEFLRTHDVNGVCMMKSTSYSPHRPLFNTLKDHILNNFAFVVQDDTGIPLKDLTTKFDVQIFGHYTKPYGVEWRGYEQNNLKKMYAEGNNTPKLNFCYGYGCGRVEANIMLATRKKEQ